MKNGFVVIALFFIITMVSGQDRKLPPKGSYLTVSETSCEFPQQTGKLEIVRNDSLKFTTYRTDCSAMVMNAYSFIGFLTAWDSADNALRLYSQYDTLVSQLFLNGLISSDLLVNAYNAKNLYINYKGDTLDCTSHERIDTVTILNIQRKELQKDYKDKSRIILFEFWVTFNPEESGWGSFLMFDLFLKSDIESNQNNVSEYLKNAKIHCLRYKGTQI